MGIDPETSIFVIGLMLLAIIFMTGKGPDE